MSLGRRRAVVRTVDDGPILVTGSHRSGTTWVGAVLAGARGARLVYEPFNRDLLARRRPFDPGRWYRAIDESNEADFDAGVRLSLTSYGYHEGAVMNVRTLRNFARDVVTFAGYAAERARRSRVVYKDPIAFFSAEWLARRHRMQPIVMIRHPAAFVASLLAKGWTFDFHEFLKQPRLMRHLAAYRDDVERLARSDADIVEQGITLWNCIYSRADTYRRLHRDWRFVRHEDLSLDPVGGFSDLYRSLGLTFGGAQRRLVEQLSGIGAPATVGTAAPLSRDSARNVDRWKRTLETRQIDRVLRGTERVRVLFYDDDDDFRTPGRARRPWS